MKTYIQKGDIITVPAPAGGIASGDGLIIGNIFGVADYSAAAGNSLELAITDVHQLPKATAAVLTVGARVAWDNTAKNINVAGAGASLGAGRPTQQGMASPASRCASMT